MTLLVTHRRIILLYHVLLYTYEYLLAVLLFVRVVLVQYLVYRVTCRDPMTLPVSTTDTIALPLPEERLSATIEVPVPAGTFIAYRGGLKTCPAIPTVYPRALSTAMSPNARQRHGRCARRYS